MLRTRQSMISPLTPRRESLPSLRHCYSVCTPTRPSGPPKGARSGRIGLEGWKIRIPTEGGATLLRKLRFISSCRTKRILFPGDRAQKPPWCSSHRCHDGLEQSVIVVALACRFHAGFPAAFALNTGRPNVTKRFLEGLERYRALAAFQPE